MNESGPSITRMLPWLLFVACLAVIGFCLKTLSEKEGESQFYQQENQKLIKDLHSKSNDWWQASTNADYYKAKFEGTKRTKLNTNNPADLTDPPQVSPRFQPLRPKK